MKPANLALSAAPIAASAMAGLLLVATSGAQSTTYFAADFDGTTVTEYPAASGIWVAPITKANLDAGTSVGNWTVNQAQIAPGTTDAFREKSIQGVGALDVTNKALKFGISIDGTTNANTPILTANLTSSLSLSDSITVSLDYASASFDGSGRSTYLTGYDSDGDRLFQLALVNSRYPNNDSTNGWRVGYYDSSGTLQYVGSPGDLNGNNQAKYDPGILKTLSVEVGASTYDISLAGSPLATGIAFRDTVADGLATIAISSSTRWTGGWFDNLSVTAASAATTGFQLVITPNGANYDFSWDSQAGKLYDLVTSTDLSTPIPGWPVYDDGVNPIYENIPSGGATTTLENVVPTGTPRFFAVVEKD